MKEKPKKPVRKRARDDPEQWVRIRRLAIAAMFLDDTLMEMFVLKGGNAVDLIYEISDRSSLDLDFSMPNAFPEADLPDIQQRLKNALEKTFAPEGYTVFDVFLQKRPSEPTVDLADFWGGYHLDVKIIPTEAYRDLQGDIDAIRRQALTIGPQSHRPIDIEISCYEHCAEKSAHKIDGWKIFVYTPAMLTIEKIRAICQQDPAYGSIVRTHTPRARARDFFDIHALIERCRVGVTGPKNTELTKATFAAKRVPLDYLLRIEDSRDLHASDFPAVEGSLKPNVKIRPFDFYFDYVVKKCRLLHQAVGIVDPPPA